MPLLWYGFQKSFEEFEKITTDYKTFFLNISFFLNLLEK